MSTPLPLRLLPVLRLALALTFVAVVLLMLVLVPAVTWNDHTTHSYSTGDALAVFGFAGLIVGLLACIEIVIVCTWRLLTFVERDEIFSSASDRWVTGIVRTVGGAWLLLAAMAPYFFWMADNDDAPGVLLIGFVLGMVATVALLLMLVMRELLRRATALRSEMDAVI